MKMKIKIPALFLAGAFALSAFAGCNDIPPAKEPSESVLESETQLTQEELIAMRDRIHQNLGYNNGYNKDHYERLCAERLAGNPRPDIITDEQWDYMDLTDYYRVLHEEPDNDYFHTTDIVLEISKGMLINEIYDNVLGAPHFVAEYASMGTTYSESDCYSYSFYVLSDGKILLIQYEPISPEDYDSLNLNKRIPNFNAIRHRYEGRFFHWRQVSNIEVLSEQELLERTFYNRDLLMPLELRKNL